MQIGDFEITKREVLVAIIITVVCLTSGIFLNNAIQKDVSNKVEISNKALKIDNSVDQFSYGIETNIGNSLVYGNIESLDVVTIPELKEPYLYIKKTKQIYTMHTRTVTHSNGKRTWTTVQTYYTWDSHSSVIKESKEIVFLNKTFSTSQFILPSCFLNLDGKIQNEFVSSVKGDYVYETSTIRYFYEITPIKISGTMLISLKNKTINPITGDKIKFNEGVTIQSQMNKNKDALQNANTIFWIIFSIVLLIGIGIFLMAENYWLE